MKQSRNLYENLYQMLILQFLSGAFLPGQKFPTQRELCLQYNAGITTVRRVVKMLDEQGYIHTAQGQPSVVTYQPSQKAYISFLVQRRDKIADAYRGLELLLPSLYCKGAKRCGKPEIKFFREQLKEISELTELSDLYKQANIFLSALLRPLNNQLIMDLELDSENYLHIPYIPIPGVENPFALTAERLRIWMTTIIYQIENGQFEELRAGTTQLYRESAKRVDDYLCTLSSYAAALVQTSDDIPWFRIKDRCELYARLTMTIIRRIIDGEFDGQKYLPSIPKLMEEYGVMKDTASRAVALLNTLGFAQTLDKKGTVIAFNGIAAIRNSVDLTDSVIRERLILFMEALQIVAVTAHSCAESFSTIPESLIPFMENRLLTAQDSRISPLSFHLLINSFIQMIPCHSLKNIFWQLDELIIWGHYLQTADLSFFPDPRDTFIAMEELVTALKKQTGLAEAYEKAFSMIYNDVCTVVSQIPGFSASPSAGHEFGIDTGR